MPPRRVRHRQAAEQHLAGLDLDQDAAVLLVLPPAARRVGLAQGGDEGRPALDQAQPVQVAAVLRGQLGDERRPPARHEAVDPVERAQAGEARVDEPEPVPCPRPSRGSGRRRCNGRRRGRKQASCRPSGAEPAGDGRGVVVFPDLQRRADGQPVAVAGQAHRLAEAAEVRVQRAVVGPEHHQLAGLVGGDEDREAQLLEDRGEAGGVHAAQRRQRCLLVCWARTRRSYQGLLWVDWESERDGTRLSLDQSDATTAQAIGSGGLGRVAGMLPACRFPQAGRSGFQLRWVVAGRGRTVSPRRTNVAALSIQASFPAGRADDVLRGLRER